MAANSLIYAWVDCITQSTITLRHNVERWEISTNNEHTLIPGDFVSYDCENNEIKLISRTQTRLRSKFSTTIVILLRSILVDICRDELKSMKLTQVYPSLLLKSKQLPTDDGTLGCDDFTLSQSSQAYLESMIPFVGSCFCIEKSFRQVTEDFNHLQEFLHVEAEFLHVIDLTDHIAKIKSFIVNVVTKFRVASQSYLIPLNCVFAEDDLECPVIKNSDWDGKIHKMTIITEIPTSFDNKDNSGVDIYVPYMGEILGSAIRQSDISKLMPYVSEYSDYVLLRATGYGKTSGFGLGLDRLLCWCLGFKDIHSIL